jgi:glycosyltransferase involved in cell wall biosynthesis
MKDTAAKLTIVMPVYNGATTLRQVFVGLEEAADKQLIDQIIIINDHSSDTSQKVIEEYAESSSYTLTLVNHESSQGLAAGYNEGARLAKTEYVLLMHQDIVLTRPDSFTAVLEPFKKEGVVATYPVLLHPYEVWKEYSFWQKCLFSRLVDKKTAMLTGKFDAFSKSFLEEVDYFDNKTYRTAGEDSDLKIKIQRRGLLTENHGVEVIHLQYAEKDFGLKKFIKKEAQYAEAQGVILRKYGLHDVKGVILSFFRQILLIGLLIPFVNIFFALLIIAYAFTYTKLVYEKEWRDPRIISVPFINIYLLFVALFVSVRGFARGRQVI